MSLGFGRVVNFLLRPTGYRLVRNRKAPPPAPAGDGAYAEDGLTSVHAHEFLEDAEFLAAYARGVKATGVDYGWRWRVHVGLWVASQAARLPGDFVECGVNRGFLSSAVMHHLRWNSLAKTFWLLDTFRGMDERYVSDVEKGEGALEANRERIASGFYVSSAADVRANFAEWERVRIVEGPIPDTLAQVEAREVAYLHLDLNCSPPEVAAAEHFWPRLVPGAFVLLDDYAYRGYGRQKEAMDAFARSKGVSVLSLPTGQGLIVKPPS